MGGITSTPEGRRIGRTTKYTEEVLQEDKSGMEHYVRHHLCERDQGEPSVKGPYCMWVKGEYKIKSKC